MQISVNPAVQSILHKLCKTSIFIVSFIDLFKIRYWMIKPECLWFFFFFFWGFGWQVQPTLLKCFHVLSDLLDLNRTLCIYVNTNTCYTSSISHVVKWSCILSVSKRDSIAVNCLMLIVLWYVKMFFLQVVKSHNVY